MINATVIYRPATADEFMRLRESVGWACPGKEDIAVGLKNSLFAVCIESNGSLIGYGRIVGDDAFTVYIQDVIVLPPYQRQGIGTIIMNEIMKNIKSRYCKGCMVCLMASKGKEAFYEKYGFVARPNDKYGAGMIQFI
jgi:GNAT superfamily N-acetyltransferase